MEKDKRLGLTVLLFKAVILKISRTDKDALPGLIKVITLESFLTTRFKATVSLQAFSALTSC